MDNHIAPASSHIDNSIFDRVASDVEQILQKYEHTKREIRDCVLFVLDDEGMEALKQSKKSLAIEYGDLGDKVAKEYSIESLVKILNENMPSFYYFLYEKETWEEVNCQNKVKERLLGRFVKYKNKSRKDHVAKWKELKYTQSMIVQKKAELEIEWAKKEKRLNEILDCWDEYEVRITKYENRNIYGAISYKTFADDTLEKEVRKSALLRISVPNVLWYKEINKVPANKKILEFLDGAEKLFDDVFVKHVNRGGVKRVEVNGKLIPM
jgi:hypothetical protein